MLSLKHLLEGQKLVGSLSRDGSASGCHFCTLTLTCWYPHPHDAAAASCQRQKVSAPSPCVAATTLLEVLGECPTPPCMFLSLHWTWWGNILPPLQTPKASGHTQPTQRMPLEYQALVAGWIAFLSP